MDVREIACVCALVILNRKRKRKKKYWIHPLNTKRLLNGNFVRLHEDLKTDPKRFEEYYHMTTSTFEELLRLIGPSIAHQNTNWRNSVASEERLSVTLRYLATGCTFVSLHQEYLLGGTTIREIVRDVCDKICTRLSSSVLPKIDTSGWLSIASEFHRKTNFPNCIGVLDGKHIRITKPVGNGSRDTIILMAVVDADYCFISADVGTFIDCSSDSQVFRRSTFGMRLERGQQMIPNNAKLPNDDDGTPMPFVFVGSDSFTLAEHVLRPFAQRTVTPPKRIFNDRLTRVRRMVECTFRILTNKWEIFQRPLDTNPEFCISIVKACCILHNFVCRRDGVNFEETLYECPLQSINPTNSRASIAAASTREYFSNYFNSSTGSVDDCR